MTMTELIGMKIIDNVGCKPSTVQDKYKPWTQGLCSLHSHNRDGHLTKDSILTLKPYLGRISEELLPRKAGNSPTSVSYFNTSGVNKKWNQYLMEITEKESRAHWGALEHAKSPWGPLEPTEALWDAVKDACSEALRSGFQAERQDLFH